MHICKVNLTQTRVFSCITNGPAVPLRAYTEPANRLSDLSAAHGCRCIPDRGIMHIYNQWNRCIGIDEARRAS